ncbi:helix-turn-helix domain-containing protein [Tsukamurella soli]|uniref:Homeodomain-like domain-containing protein n=1 Tax=Tsukamurella soli TaxID=644556 RepID=A0ABP8JQ21_9ACTN
MTRQVGEFAVANAETRAQIAAEYAADPTAVDAIAARHGISVSTVRSYAEREASVARTVAALDAYERDVIWSGCARGARARWERTYGAEVVARVLGE